MDQPTNQSNIKKALSNNPKQNHKSQQLQLVVGPLWPGVMVPLGVLLVGRMYQNMNLKEKWVYEEKVSSFKNGYKSYNSYVNRIWHWITHSGWCAVKLKQPTNLP